MTDTLLYEPPADVRLDDLEATLTRAFHRINAALQRGRAVVVALDERDVEGVGGPAAAALAHGLLGLARALAVEGGKEGRRIAVLSAPAELDSAERAAWVEQLAASPAASGTLVRLGGGHLGRVPT